MLSGHKRSALVSKSRKKLSAAILISRLTEKSIHILLIVLNTGLIEGINTEHIAGDSASKLEEVDHISVACLVLLCKLQNDIRNSAVIVRKSGCLEGIVVDLIERFACDKVQSIKIGGIGRNLNGRACVNISALCALVTLISITFYNLR